MEDRNMTGCQWPSGQGPESQARDTWKLPGSSLDWPKPTRSVYLEDPRDEEKMTTGKLKVDWDLNKHQTSMRGDVFLGSKTKAEDFPPPNHEKKQNTTSPDKLKTCKSAHSNWLSGQHDKTIPFWEYSEIVIFELFLDSRKDLELSFNAVQAC